MEVNASHPVIDSAGREMADGKLDRREFLRIATLIGVSAGAAYGLAGIPKVAAAEPTPRKGGVLRFGNRVQDISSPHTYAWTEQSNITRQVAEYLTNTGPDNVTRPTLLENWTASPDLKTWDLRVRKGVTWRKGRAFTADDVVWNLNRLLDYKTGSSTLGLFQSFILKQTETEEIGKDGAKKKVWVPWDAQAIQKVDDFTVRLTGQAPNLAIPEFLCSFPNLMLDPSENGVFGVGANGTGPFELTEYEAGRRAVLTARKSGYWGKGPYLDRVEVIDLGDDSAAQVAAIAAKQVDLLREGAISALPAVEKLPHVKVSKVNSAYTAVARMQPKKPFDDARVRRAMRYATDSAACLKVALRELGLPGEHFHIAPVQPAYAKIPDTGRDVAKAKALLAEAGYKDGVDIEITCKPQPDWELLAVQAMVEQWKEVGVRAKINVVPSAQYWDHFKDYPFSFTQWSHRPLATMVLELAYRTGVPWNESKWSNKEFDDLLTEAEKYLDVEKRREVMAKIEKVMFEDGPLVLPCWRAVFTFLDKKIQNFQVAPDLMYDFKEVWVEA